MLYKVLASSQSVLTPRNLLSSPFVQSFRAECPSEGCPFLSIDCRVFQSVPVCCLFMVKTQA